MIRNPGYSAVSSSKLAFQTLRILWGAAALGVVVACKSQTCSDGECDANSLAPSPTSAASDATSSRTEPTTTEEPSETRTCRVSPDCNEAKPVCSQLGQCVACTRDEHCDGDRPTCLIASDERDNRCVACRVGTDCGPEGQWHCISEQCYAACDPSAESPCEGDLVCVAGRTKTESYCAQCGPGAACADSTLLCVDNRCVTCNPEDNAGCDGETPFCVVPPAHDTSGDAGAANLPSEAMCKQCITGDHCESGACVDGACKPCDPRDNAGCGGETPICVRVPPLGTEPQDGGTRDGLTDPDAMDSDAEAVFSCVQCGNEADCSQHDGGAFCVAGACSPCNPDTNDGCSVQTPECVNVSPPGQPPTYACRECEDRCEGSLVCLNFGCVECATHSDCKHDGRPQCSPDHTCEGCSDASACAERPGLPFCLEQTGACVACLGDDDCEGTATPACSPDTNECVQCTSDNHCPEEAMGCNVFPGLGVYTCLMPIEPGKVRECHFCNAGDCAEGLRCAALGDVQRCLPLANDDDECATYHSSVDDGESLPFCVPDECAQ